MIHKIIINNFKKLEEISFQFSNSVVIIGPNNAGKTTIFQALCLWEIGVISYLDAEKRNKLNKNRAVTINRKNLINSPISDVRFLWKDKKTTITSQGKIEHIRLEVEIQGENNGKLWNCKTEFYYYNEESFSCKVVSGFKNIKDIYENQGGVHFGFLQPTSGLSTTEDKLTQGSIDRMLGEGKTSEVLRNICYDILYPEHPKHENYNPTKNWNSLCKNIKKLFNADLQKPELIKVTGLIQLEYIENKIKYDVSASGTGFRQLLLLLSYMYSHPNTILLLDEPDAHLEVVRQREVFKVLREVAEETNSQIIIASHSEVVLNEAVATSNVIALIENKVFELNVNKSPKLLASINKALTEYGWDYYYQARLKGHIIFLEGITDRLMLQEFANKLNHPIASLLEFANFDYTDDNKPSTAIKKHESLKEFFPELKTLALFDKIEGIDVDNIKSIKVMCWKRRELENYFARPFVLIKYAVSLSIKYPHLRESLLKETMEKIITENTAPARLKDLNHNWWINGKLSDEWLDVIFPEFYKVLKITDYSKNVKKTYYELIKFLDKNDVDIEISERLDVIYSVLS